ncbi:MAG: hypothetical protein K2M71_11695 [Duncaniella sp.]|nr:hypothetical protein [Bacteroides sp.]MBD5354994.1 hypothetical protein [Bacteroides sp.]MDE5827521.1 hypothetical protein [Duncaniella sp.]MDE6825031.1 hypothetical protein [Duncaniella sp.]MDE7476281.1 hypothetical protein [Duncaniella sp.]
MKKILLLFMIVASLATMSCTKRVEGILREQPDEISKKEAVKLLDCFNEQLTEAQTLLEKGDKRELELFLKSQEWELAERCHNKLIQLPPQLTTELRIGEMEINFVEFVNAVIKTGIPLRELPEQEN